MNEQAGVVPRIARAWAELTRRLGYQRYGAQGGGGDTPSRGSWASSTPAMSSACV
jgi:hypothetical protein